MYWTSVDKRWAARKDLQPGQELESGVTFSIENWVVPGEDPLPVRVVTRKGFPLSSYSSAQSITATSITLHETAGYGNFAGMMGGNDPAHPTKVGAHFMTGRDGNAYLLIPVDRVAWHANAWSLNSIGIEIDNIGALHEVSGKLSSEYGDSDVYCAKSDTGVYLEKDFQGVKYWATWTSDQYDCTARLIKAICHKLQIPRYIQPEPDRYAPLTKFTKAQLAKFKGVMTHYQVNPGNRADIGPYIDWDRLIHSAGLTEGDCFNTPAYSDELTNPGTPAETDSSNTDGEAAAPVQSAPAESGPADASGATSASPSAAASFNPPVMSAGAIDTSAGPLVLDAPQANAFETPAKLPKYVFVLSMENRSFDHLFGRSGIKGGDAQERGTTTEVNGVFDPGPEPRQINPEYFNEYDGKRYSVADVGDAPTVMSGDPHHEYEHILCQTCGPDAMMKVMKAFNARPDGLGYGTLPASYWASVPRPSQSFPLYKMAEWNGVQMIKEPEASTIPDRGEPNNKGFVHSYVRSYNKNKGTAGSNTPDTAETCPDPGSVMACYDTATQLPVLYELASKYTICDNFFSSLPGPTAPNRFFMMGGSSGGHEASPTTWEMVKWTHGSHVPLENGTVFTHLSDADVDWKVFGDDNFPMAEMMQGVHFSGDVHGLIYESLQQQLARAQTGTEFPYNFVWIEPDYDVMSATVGRHPMYARGNSMHPCGDIGKGEQLIADVYNWIYNCKPVWENCVLFITWDEHGAFYDHVPSPPCSAPGGGDPIGRTWDFDFKRLGARVPCLVISPLIEPNLIDHRQYDHTSILKTVIDLNNAGAFNGGTAKNKMKAWTQRIDDAASMIDLFSIGPSYQAQVTLSPRTDLSDGPPDSANIPHPDARPTGNVPSFLMAALNRHKDIDPKFDIEAQARKLTTNKAAFDYFQKVDAMVNAHKQKKAYDPNLPVS